MTAFVALLRGINVGKAKRIAMADLRALFEDLGYAEVQTLLNSGNVLFEAARPNPRKIIETVEKGIERRFGFAVPTVVTTGEEFRAASAGNPLLLEGRDHAKLLVAFPRGPRVLAAARALLAEDWTPEALAVDERVAYLWCPGGIIDSRLMKAFARATGEDATARNWATVQKLIEALATAAARRRA